jgi:hypothetical protein
MWVSPHHPLPGEKGLDDEMGSEFTTSVLERCGAGLVDSRCRADPVRRRAKWARAMWRCRPTTGVWVPG